MPYFEAQLDSIQPIRRRQSRRRGFVLTVARAGDSIGPGYPAYFCPNHGHTLLGLSAASTFGLPPTPAKGVATDLRISIRNAGALFDQVDLVIPGRNIFVANFSRPDLIFISDTVIGDFFRDLRVQLTSKFGCYSRGQQIFTSPPP